MKLRDLLEQVEKTPPEERMALSGEIDVARALCEKALQLYGAAHVEDGSSDVSPSTKATAVVLVQSALDQVSKLVERAAKVEMMSSQNISREQWVYFCRQLVRTLNEKLLPDHAGCYDEVIKMIGDIKLPQRSAPVVTIAVE